MRYVGNSRGFGVIIALFVMLAFAFVVAFLASIIGTKGETPVIKLYSSQALSIAESGGEVGMRAIRDDVTAAFQITTPTANGYCENPSFDGNVAAGSGGTGTANDARVTGDGNASYTLNSNGDTIDIYQFYQMVNFLGTRVKDVEVGCRCRRTTGTGANPSLILQYSTDGGGAWTTVSTTTVSNAAFSFIYTPIPGVNDWLTLFTDNFRVRAGISGGTNRDIDVDYLFVRITVELDANTEPWRSNSYISLPKNFTGGQITGIDVNDESGKINLNTIRFGTSAQDCLRYLMVEYGVADGTANTVAGNIVTYAASNTFYNVEQLMQVSGMTSAIYNATITDPDYGSRKLYEDFTVYSWSNNQVVRPAGTSPFYRAPVNVNTASRSVLRAVFRPLTLGAGDYSTLADAIRTQRATQPFGCMFATNPDSDDFSFRQFLVTAPRTTYLTATEANTISENADASSTSWDGTNVVTAEFSYYSNSFMIKGTGVFPSSGSLKIQRAIRVLYGDVYNYTTFGYATEGSLKIPVTTTETGYSGYWREQ